MPLLWAAALGCGAAAAAQRPARAPDEFNLAEPQPGVYVHLGKNLPLDTPGHDDIANIGFIVGSGCVAVIDTGGSVQIGRELRDQILRRTSLPICYVIDTHVHVDHVLGNFAFTGDRPHFVGHAALAYQSLAAGLSRIALDPERVAEDLGRAWEVLGEAVQTVMRAHGIPDAYERLKQFTRGRPMDATTMREFIRSLDLPPADKARLLELTPATYLGLAAELARRPRET